MVILRAAVVAMAVATQLPQVRVCGCERASERDRERLCWCVSERAKHRERGDV